MRKRIFCIIGLLALVGHPAVMAIPKIRAAAPGDAAAPRRLVLDVVALKDGKPAGDLAEADFELYEDGKKIPLRYMSYIQTASQKRLAVIFHDMNLWIKNVQRDKDDISEELIGLANLGIELAIMRLDSPGGLKILQPFTRDEALIRKAAASALAKMGMNESYDNLGGRFMDIQGAERLVQNESQNLLLSYYYTKRQRFENTIGGLMAAGCFLQDFPGRKSILLVSGGIPDLSSSSQIEIMSSGDRSAALDAIHERARRTTTRSRLFDPFGLLKGESFEQSDQVLDRLVQFSNARNISIYALDSGVFAKNVFMVTSEFARTELTESDSIQGEERAKEVQSLREVAEGTSGLLFRGANKFIDLKKSLDADLEGYYELAFKSEGQKADGKYHKITVKTGRRDVSLRYRKGYREDTPEEARKMLLISAYYSPDLFHGLPFSGLFVPFVNGSGKFEAWISLALPVKPLFIDNPRASSPITTFSLFVWLREREQESQGFAVNIDIPVKMTDALRDSLPDMTHIWSFFKGPELALKKTGYDVVYVLHDAQTGEIGGWSSALAVPDLRSDDRGVVVNRVLGTVASNPQGITKALALNPKNGILDFNEVKFYPRVTNQFSAEEDAWVFLQAHLPLRKDKDSVSPQFTAWREGALPQTLGGELIAESWNAKTKIWSGICRLGLNLLGPGEHVLRITVPAGSGNGGLTTEIKFNKGE
jgi:VWFA-related protein